LQTKVNLLGYSLSSLEDFFKNINEPKFRAKQLLKWIHQKGVINFDQMTDFNKLLREKLNSMLILLLHMLMRSLSHLKVQKNIL